MPHEDGDAYHPVVATVSLGAPIVLDLYEKGDGPRVPKWRILQEPRSLLVTTRSAYGALLHGIASIERDEDLSAQNIVNWELLGDQTEFTAGSYDRTTRTSLTYRDVLKVSKLGNKLLGRR